MLELLQYLATGYLTIALVVFLITVPSILMNRNAFESRADQIATAISMTIGSILWFIIANNIINKKLS